MTTDNDITPITDHAYDDDKFIESLADIDSDGFVDMELKMKYHNKGFNIVELNADKIPIDNNGKKQKGRIKDQPHKPIPDHVKRAVNWGIRHTTDPRCQNKILFDWDSGIIPPAFKKKIMCMIRNKPDQDSFHGVIEIPHATKEWIMNFLKTHEMPGLEMFAYNQTLAIRGTYNIKGYPGAKASWRPLDSLTRVSDMIKVVLMQELDRNIPKKARCV